MSAATSATPSDPPWAVVVEDDAEAMSLIAAILTRSGFRVQTVETAQGGIDAVRALDPMVTTVDMLLPGMDGTAAIRRIRAFSSTAIMVISGLDDEVDILSGLAAGADAYVVKPVRPAEFRARLRAVLRRSATVVPTAATAAVPTAQMADVSPDVRAHVPADAPPGDPDHPVAAPVAALVTTPAGPPVESPSADAEPSDAESRDAEPVDDEPSRYAEDTIVLGALILYPYDAVATLDDVALTLSDLEFDLLEVVVQAGARPRSSAELARLVRDGEVSSETVAEVEAAMARVMETLGEDPAFPRWIIQDDRGYRPAPRPHRRSE